MFKYLVIEIQTYKNGTINTLTYDYDERLEAESKYYTILASAAVSTFSCHAAVFMTSEGQVLEHSMYKHEVEDYENA